MKTLKSKEDASVNFIFDSGAEARYVRREKHYMVCYLSSQTACRMGCQFCWLTATGQTKYRNLTYQEIIDQAKMVLDHYSANAEEAQEVNFNFMSRGEPLDNEDVDRHLLWDLTDLAVSHHLTPKFNVSTIMPRAFTASKKDLAKRFAGVYPTMYYSLYSMDPKFRDKWLPGASNPEVALDLLAEYQRISKKIIKLHRAYIEGENDSYEDFRDITDAVKKRNLICEFNCVRYNPFSPEQGKESEMYQTWTNRLDEELSGKSKVVTRVGPDCFASCGMFVS